MFSDSILQLREKTLYVRAAWQKAISDHLAFSHHLFWVWSMQLRQNLGQAVGLAFPRGTTALTLIWSDKEPCALQLLSSGSDLSWDELQRRTGRELSVVQMMEICTVSILFLDVVDFLE